SARGAARPAADGGGDARSAGNVLLANCRTAGSARGYGQIADQSRPQRARAPDQEAARRALQAERRLDAFRHCPFARSLQMNVTTDQVGRVTVVRVGESR